MKKIINSARRNENTENPECPYCKRISVLVTGKEIYPHRTDLFAKRFYSCKSCDAYVGCHPGTTKPLGRLADKELRIKKLEVHTLFDPIWNIGVHTNGRALAYKWLSEATGIEPSRCHVGMFSVDDCDKAIKAIKMRAGILAVGGSEQACNTQSMLRASTPLAFGTWPV